MAQTRTEAKPAPEALNDIEGILKVSLQPIRPNQEFVNKLGRRLVNPSNTTLEPRTSAALTLLVVGLGLLCGVLVVILGKRSIVLLLAALLALLLPRLKKEEIQEQVILLPPLR
jgi:hypothetical protein